MAYGINARLQIMLRHAEHVRLYTHADGPTTFAVMDVGGNAFTLSGPPERVASVLRELADKVDAMAQEPAVAG
jgi:hypothetical protein